MKKDKSKRLIAVLLILSLAVGATVAKSSIKRKDEFIKERVVQLSNERGSCSGEQIRAPSGVNYILSAAHCKELADVNGNMKITREDGSTLLRRVIAEDINSDLLLIEGVPNLSGLSIAEISLRDQHVTTYTHGRGFPTYKTEGYLIFETVINIPLGLADEMKCDMPKNKVIEYNVWGNILKICVLSLEEMVTTAMIVPGSSGGAVLNDRNELVGVVSAGDGSFGYLVTLDDINSFLSAY